MLGYLVAGCALFGLALGSFLNVVIYRVPRHESIVSPRSHCPSCATPLREIDNIPVVSWLILRGKCRTCHVAISPRYLVVELACAALFAGGAARLGFRADLPAVLVLLAALLALGSVDLELLVLPKSMVYSALALVSVLFLLAATGTNAWGNAAMAAECAAAWTVLFFLMNLVSPRILGFGDVRLALLLGVGLGWFGWRYAVLGFFAGNFIGAVIGVTLIVTKKMRRDQPVPYGVFLALGAAVAIFAGPAFLGPLPALS